MKRFPLLLLLPFLLALAAPDEGPPPPPAVVGESHSVSASCTAFLPEDRPACAERLTAYRATMDRLLARKAAAEPTEACLLHCEMLQENWKLGVETRGWSERAVRSLASGAYDRRNASLRSGRSRRDQLKVQRAEVEAELTDLRKGRVIHLYENTETGAIVEHAGDRFEPQPPLRYVGEKRAPHFESGERRIARLEKRLAELDAALDGVAAEMAPLETPPERAVGAEEMISHMWGDACSEAEAQAWLGSCRAQCHGAPPDPDLRICTY